MKSDKAKPSVLVAIPCRNEALTVAKVVRDFRRELPDATILVIDNNSTDATADCALEAGATVIREHRPGKGNVVQTVFRTCDADICVLVDGDDTYPAEAVHSLIRPVAEDKADMSVGTRLQSSSSNAFRSGHAVGNRLLTAILNMLFRANMHDILSGYRVFSRDFMERVPLITEEFQIETEMTIQALEKRMRIAEVPVELRPRPPGSTSKLRSFHDGVLILLTIAMYMRDHSPLRFFLALSGAWVIAGEGLVWSGWFPSMRRHAVDLQGIVILGALVLFAAGLIISAINTRFRELESSLWKKRKT